MKHYKNEKGFDERQQAIIRSADRLCNFVKMKTGETFILNLWLLNDSDKACYKVFEGLDGTRYNVNLNNGIAYKTNK